MRSIQRKYQTSFNTILKLLEDAGDMAISHFASLSGLDCRWIQIDEFHTYVGAREKDQEPESRRDTGVVWVYLAMDAETKLIVDYLAGTREVYDATDHLKSVAAKLRRNEHGEFAVRPTIITDGLPAYKEAAQVAFGTDADVGMMVKQYSEVSKNGVKLARSRYIGAERKAVIGSPAREKIHTSYIERLNLNVRMDVKRFTRRSNAFSKKLLNLKRHMALYAMYHNYCRIHGRLKITPAMAAGLTDHVWDIDELVELTNRMVIERMKRSIANDDEPVAPPVTEGAPTHWVYRSPVHYLAKVHQADCHHCKDRDWKVQDVGKYGQWLPFHSLDEAEQAAREFEPDRYTYCNMCIGSYRNAGGYRGPRR